MGHKVYTAIVTSVRAGRLTEPFTVSEFRRACPGFGAGTYNAFLSNHARGNPGGTSELFKRVGPGQYRCLRPFRYEL